MTLCRNAVPSPGELGSPADHMLPMTRCLGRGSAEPGRARSVDLRISSHIWGGSAGDDRGAPAAVLRGWGVCEASPAGQLSGRAALRQPISSTQHRAPLTRLINGPE